MLPDRKPTTAFNVARKIIAMVESFAALSPFLKIEILLKLSLIVATLLANARNSINPFFTIPVL